MLAASATASTEAARGGALLGQAGQLTAVLDPLVARLVDVTAGPARRHRPSPTLHQPIQAPLAHSH